MIKMSTETGISSLFYLQLFQWHVWKQLASVNFLFVEIAKNFGIATERKLTFDSRTFFTSKFDPNWDLNFKTVLFDNKCNALLLWKPSWLQINRKNQHLTPFFTGPNIVERDFLFTLNAKCWMKLAVTHCQYLCNQPSCINSRLNIQVKFHSSSTLNTCVKSQWLPITHALNKTFFVWLKPGFLHTSINGFHGFFACPSHCFCLKS